MKKRLLTKIFITVLIIALCSLLIYLGVKLHSNEVNLDPLKWVLLVEVSLFVLLLIVNAFIGFFVKKKRIDTNLVEKRVLEKKKFAEENILEYYKKVKKLILHTDLYLVFVLFLLVSINILFCLLVMYIEAFSIFLIPFIIIFIVSLFFIIGSDMPKEASKFELKEKDYPQLNALVNKIAQMFDIKKKVKCYFSYYYNAGVIELDNEIRIGLGIQTLYLLSEKELENILIHEFAHIHLNHTSKSIILNKRTTIWNNLNKQNLKSISKFVRIMYNPIFSYLNYYIELFRHVSSIQKEDEADLIVEKKGSKQDFINALAKLNLYEIFLKEEFCPIVEVFEHEEPTDHYFTLLYNLFLKYYDIYKVIWNDLILRRIPARIESHRTFKHRMELLGLNSFTISFDEKFLELDKIVSYANKLIKDDIIYDYKHQRKENYLYYKELIEKYEANEDLGKNSLLDVANAYRKFGNIRNALKIYNNLIEEKVDRNKAFLFKGTALLSLYDSSGIEYIYKVMEANYNYLKYGIEKIAEYCLKMGLENELKRIREYAKKNRDFIFNILPKIGVFPLDRFKKTHLSNEVISEVINHITKDKKIERVYVADKVIDKTYRLTIVGIFIKPDLRDKLEEVLPYIYGYLQYERKENFYLLPLNYYPQFVYKFTNIKKSLKYYDREL